MKVDTAVHQPEVEKLQQEKKQIETQIQYVTNAQQKKVMAFQSFINAQNYPTAFGGALIGGLAGIVAFEELEAALVGSIIGGALASLASPDKTPEREIYIKNTINRFNNEIRLLNQTMEGYQKRLKTIKAQLFLLKPSPGIKAQTVEGSGKKMGFNAIQPNVKPSALQPFTKNNSDIRKSKKVVSSSDLLKMDYKQFDFKGRWLDFIGTPAINFFTAIHGKAGEGKSTFAIQFANYLATNFGKVIYISGEEGFSQTFKEKFERLGVTAPNLFVADLRVFEDIKTELKNNDYHFILIDSLDTLRMGPDEIKQLRQMLPNNAFITISQSTKDGKMRGSNEIIHDCDIVIQVADGVATTTKNRFLERDRIFDVF
jgi:DNA replication protein DnaC